MLNDKYDKYFPVGENVRVSPRKSFSYPYNQSGTPLIIVSFNPGLKFKKIYIYNTYLS